MQSIKHQQSEAYEFNFRPLMANDETLAGYLLRFAEANVLAGLRGVARFAGLDPWDLFGPDRLALARLLWGTGAERRPDYRLLCEAPAPGRYGASAYRRVCAVCLQKSPAKQAHGVWDEPMSTHCKTHRVLLTATCASCSLPLDYMRDQGVARCGCGATLEDQQPTTIPYWLPFVHFVLDPATCTKTFDGMTANATAAQILQQIASLSDPTGDAATAPALLGHPLASQDAVTLSQSWFNNWPHGFSDSLSKRGHRPGMEVPIDLARFLGRDNFPEVRCAIERHEQADPLKVVRQMPNAAGRLDAIGRLGQPEASMVVHYPLAFVPMRFALRHGVTRDIDEYASLSQESASNEMAVEPPVHKLVGMLPHLALMWLTTRTLEGTFKARDLTWSDLVRFASEMGFSASSGGKFGSLTRLRAALVGLLATDLTDLKGEYRSTGQGETAAEPLRIGARFHEEPRELAADPIVVSPWFVREICIQTCTVRSHVFRALKGSRIAQLLYVVVQARVVKNERLVVSLGELADSVGMACNSQRRLRQTMIGAVRLFNARCPDAVLAVDGDEVHIFPNRS